MALKTDGPREGGGGVASRDTHTHTHTHAETHTETHTETQTHTQREASSLDEGLLENSGPACHVKRTVQSWALAVVLNCSKMKMSFLAVLFRWILLGVGFVNWLGPEIAYF